MNSNPSIQSKVFLGIVALILALPLPLSFLPQGNPASDHLGDWLHNRSLKGVTVKVEPVVFSLNAWFSGALQKGVTQHVNTTFAFRELGIRCYNQLLWSVFEKSYMANESVIKGSDGNLFENGYLYHFQGMSIKLSDADLDQFAKDLADIQHLLNDDGRAFALLITPSKATTYPQSVPSRFVPKKKDFEKDFERLVPFLKKYGVSYVDGPAIAKRANPTLRGLAFPKTGIHWSTPLAAITAQELVGVLIARLSSPPSAFTLNELEFDHVAETPDNDLGLLLNLLWDEPSSYVHTTVRRLGRQKGDRLTIVGGSFVHQLARIYDQAKTWDSISHYYYYKLTKFSYPGGKETPIDEDKIDWQKDFADAGAVVLEVNESALGWNHPKAFIAGFKKHWALASHSGSTTNTTVELEFPESDWYANETIGNHTWRWSDGSSELWIRNGKSAPENVLVAFQLQTFGIARTIRFSDLKGRILKEVTISPADRLLPVEFPVSLPARKRFRVVIEATGSPIKASALDNRNLSFSLHNVSLKLQGPTPTAAVSESLAKSPTLLWTSPAWFELEKDGTHTWRWSSGNADVSFVPAHGDEEKVHLRFEVQSNRRARELRLLRNGREIWKAIVESQTLQAFDQTLVLNANDRLRFETDIPGEHPNELDTRMLAFSLHNVTIEPSP